MDRSASDEWIRTKSLLEFVAASSEMEAIAAEHLGYDSGFMNDRAAWGRQRLLQHIMDSMDEAFNAAPLKEASNG